MTPQVFESLKVPINLSWGEAAILLNDTAQGVLLAVDSTGSLIRTFTDGDMRRALLQSVPVTTLLADLPGRDTPIYVRDTATPSEIQALIAQHGISHVPVVDDSGRLVDLITTRDLSQRIWLSSPHLGDEESVFVEEAFRTNWIAPLGPHVDAFERELATHVGVGHAAALSSGTAAIHLGLLLLGVQPGDTVFCSSLTFVASCNPILYCNALPVFIDSEPDTWNMSPRALEKSFEAARRENRLPRCVILVNLYGQSADMEALLPICERYNVPVLEDAAESLGARYKGRASGSFGQLAVYSFNGNKIITTSGGGMLVSNDATLVARARKLSTQAREVAPHYEHEEVGFNYRMSNVLAGIGRGQLRVLDERVRQRRRVFERYQQALADIPFLRWMPEPKGCLSTRWLTCFRLEGEGATAQCRALMRLMERHSIEVRPVWKPMHLQPLFRNAPYFPHADGVDVSRQLFETGLCLPSGSNLSEAQQDRVIAHLRRVLTSSLDTRALA